MAIIDPDVRQLVEQLLESPLSWLGSEIMTEIEARWPGADTVQQTMDAALGQLRVFEALSLEFVRNERAINQQLSLSADELQLNELKILWNDERQEDLLRSDRGSRLATLEEAVTRAIEQADASIRARYDRRP